jgi:hypothetical protein
LLVSVHASVLGFNIFAGVWLGICAGLLWTAQGTIMVSYPIESQKGALPGSGASSTWELSSAVW